MWRFRRYNLALGAGLPRIAGERWSGSVSDIWGILNELDAEGASPAPRWDADVGIKVHPGSGVAAAVNYWRTHDPIPRRKVSQERAVLRAHSTNPFRVTHHGRPGAGMTHRIVFLDRSTLQAKVRAPAFEHTLQEYPVTAVGELPERLRDATIAITNKVPLRAETLQRLRKLKMIAVAATGYDVIDIPYCKANGIAVTNIRNYAVHTVPEHAFTLITALRRNLARLLPGC